MNGKDIFLGLQFVGDDLVEEAEDFHFSAQARSHAAAPEKRRGAFEEKPCAKSRRTLLVAIVCLLALLLAGCGIAYMLSLRQLELGTQTMPLPTDASQDGTAPTETEMQLTVFSLQGIEGTPNCQASQEWLAFTQSYTPSGGDYWDSDPAYWAYSVQDQTMVDKLDEICAKYGLSVIGKPWHEQIDCNQFLPLLGVDSLLKPDSAASLSIPAGRYFPGGSFTIYGTLSLGEASETFTYQCVKKDVFYDVFGYTNPETVTERNYTTSDGIPLLFLESEQSSMILADRENCFLSLSITLTGSVTLEQIAECFDFTISPQAPDPAAADAREQTSNDMLNSMLGDPNIYRRPTYGEYIQDLITDAERGKSWYAENPEDTTSAVTYAFYDADGNGTEELLVFYSGYIGSIVGMKDGVTDEGKSYHLLPYEDHVFIHWPTEANGRDEYWYHIFRFANNDDPVFSNPKERSIVRLKKDADGNWWRTSSTDHYAEFDTQITEDEAQAILNSYKPITLVKETNTGENLGGWKIGLYYDADCTNPIPDSPFVTGADGTVAVSGLQPGTLYAKEIPTDDPYWEFDTAVKTVTIQVNQTASVTFTNTQYGRIQIVKTTNTGNHLGGWTFLVRDSSGKTVGEFTTDENGYAITGNLPLGRYTVMELPTEDVYWIGELGFHTMLVTGGKDVTDTWLNREQGIGWFYKKTNTGENVEGWKITIYSDPECTQEVGTITTNEEGRGGYYLDPGIYYAKETGDEYGRFEDEYWMVDESVQKVEILPHQDTEITFTNVQYGKLKILKTIEDGTSAAGWQFRVTDAAGAEVEGSPFTTSEDGTILETLLPGEYTVEEILPEDSLYVCKSENPQKVSVVQGQIAEVAFINGIRTGRITIQKVDTQRNPLSGATFLLEWSEDGALWWPVTFSETAIKGGCANADLVDGILTSGEDGILEWTNLHPGLQYRLTEVKAPDGYKLLPDVAFSGELPADGLTVELTVVNARTFTMPETGSASGTILKVLSLLTALGCLGLLLARKRRP